jgi:hypothetical protein
MAPATDAAKRSNHMPKSIKFTSSGASSTLGNFSSGDIARNIPDALADHLVKEAMCAEYLGDTQKPAIDPVAEEPAVTPKRGRKAAASEQKED